MTEKAIKYVINGMLDDNRELFVKRLAFIFHELDPEVLNRLVDGIPVHAEVDLTKFTTRTSARNAKCRVSISGVDVEYDYDEVRYRKPGTDDTWGRGSKNEEYTEEFLYERHEKVFVRNEDCERQGVSVVYENELPI